MPHLPLNVVQYLVAFGLLFWRPARKSIQNIPFWHAQATPLSISTKNTLCLQGPAA